MGKTVPASGLSSNFMFNLVEHEFSPEQRRSMPHGVRKRVRVEPSCYSEIFLPVLDFS